MAALCLLLGDGITDDTLLHIASFLVAKDLIRLQLTSKRFAAKRIAPSRGGGKAGAAAAAPLSGRRRSRRRRRGGGWRVAPSRSEVGWHISIRGTGSA